jgi:hypothetical protein
MNFPINSVVLTGIVFSSAAFSAQPAAEGAKQPVFLICPKHHNYSAWSLALVVDRNNPQKVLSAELDELIHKNAEDSTYEEVVAAQRNPKTPRRVLGALEASQFGRGEINVRENDALHLSLTPAGKDAFRLNLSMRINLDQRFELGGKAEGKRDVLIRYNPESKSWYACAERLVDAEGHNAARGCLPLTGITFPVTGTGIYRVIAATDTGDAVILMDK